MPATTDASDHWLIVESSHGALYVYDLDDDAREVLSIPLERGGGASMIAIGRSVLAYTNRNGSYAWCFDHEWHACGSLDGQPADWWPRPVAIGDVIWMGVPRHSAAHDEPGRVLGYDIR